MENPNTTVKAVPVPDRKMTDQFGNPKRWILKIVEPRELYGLIAFPHGFEVAPNKTYVVDVVKRGKNYAIVQLHQHKWEEVKREENPYGIKIVLHCKCGAWDVERIEKFGVPLATDWKSRWYVQYAIELRRRAEEVIKNAPPRRYYYIAVRDAEASEKLFVAMKSGVNVCKEHRIAIYDDEAGKTRVIEAWRGAKDKSWVCSQYPPLGYVPVFGWVDVESFKQYEEAKAEAERLWKLSEEILVQQIDIGRCIPDGRGACRRYASRLASFL